MSNELKNYIDSNDELTSSLAKVEDLKVKEADENSASFKKALAIAKMDSLAIDKAGREWRATVTKPRKRSPKAIASAPSPSTSSPEGSNVFGLNSK